MPEVFPRRVIVAEGLRLRGCECEQPTWGVYVAPVRGTDIAASVTAVTNPCV